MSATVASMLGIEPWRLLFRAHRGGLVRLMYDTTIWDSRLGDVRCRTYLAADGTIVTTRKQASL